MNGKHSKHKRSATAKSPPRKKDALLSRDERRQLQELQDRYKRRRTLPEPEDEGRYTP